MLPLLGLPDLGELVVFVVLPAAVSLGVIGGLAVRLLRGRRDGALGLGWLMLAGIVGALLLSPAVLFMIGPLHPALLHLGFSDGASTLGAVGIAFALLAASTAAVVDCIVTRYRTRSARSPRSYG